MGYWFCWGGRGKECLASQVPVLLGECCCMVLAHRRCAHTGKPPFPSILAAGGHPDLLQMLQTTLVGGRQGPAAQDPGEGGPQA